MLFSRNRGVGGVGGVGGIGSTMPSTMHGDDFGSDMYELESRNSSEERFNLKL